MMTNTSTKIWQCAVFENKYFLKIFLFYQKKMLSELYFIKYSNFWGKFIIFFFQIILRLDEIWDTKIYWIDLINLSNQQASWRWGASTLPFRLMLQLCHGIFQTFRPGRDVSFLGSWRLRELVTRKNGWLMVEK